MADRQVGLVKGASSGIGEATSHETAAQIDQVWVRPRSHAAPQQDAHIDSSLCQVALLVFVRACDVPLFHWGRCSRRVSVGPGVAWPKSRRLGV